MMTINRNRLFLSPDMGGEEFAVVRDAFASNYIAPPCPMADKFGRALAE